MDLRAERALRRRDIVEQARDSTQGNDDIGRLIPDLQSTTISYGHSQDRRNHSPRLRSLFTRGGGTLRELSSGSDTNNLTHSRYSLRRLTQSARFHQGSISLAQRHTVTRRDDLDDTFRHGTAGLISVVNAKSTFEEESTTSSVSGNHVSNEQPAETPALERADRISATSTDLVVNPPEIPQETNRVVSPEMDVISVSTSKNQIPIVTRLCSLCRELTTGEDAIKANFPYTCNGCNQSNYCLACIKDWFLDACRNESKMPPKCCYAIPLFAVIDHLTASQIELFKAKHEEWSTPDRLYCPVLSCSAFISPRLYKHTIVSPPPTPSESEPSVGENVPASPKSTVISTKPNVPCPECHTMVCTSCSSVVHSGPCAENDVDPDLAALLEKWKIKRCPKCRTGVRKMYGCTHVECHCGAHFCYGCLSPYTECEGGCDNDDDENPDPADFEEDDLDGRAGFFDGDGHDIGEEPNPDSTDIWGCSHSYDIAVGTSVTTGSNQLYRPECQHCFKTVYFAGEEPEATQSYHKEKAPEIMDGEDTVMTGTEEASLRAEQQPWKCFCGSRTCAKCPLEPPRHRRYNAAWKWHCECGGTWCYQCDRDQARQNTNVCLDVAWSCRCGKILCGTCKEVQEEEWGL